MSFSVDSIIALGQTPISEAAPAGESIRYDESFEQLQAQLDRLGSLDGVPVDWPKVVELATSILGSKSKDLLVLSYLTLGLFEQHGYAGLSAGLDCWRGMVEKFWEPAFPKVKPPQARVNAVQYMVDRLLAKLDPKDGHSKRPPNANEKEAVHRCAELARELSTAFDTAFSPLGAAPNFAPLERALKTLREKVGPLAPPPGAAPAEAGAAGAPSSAATAAPEGAAAGPSVPSQFTTPTQAAESIGRVARYFYSQDNKDPRAYLLLRAVAFGGLLEAPRDRLIPGPPPQRRQFFDSTAAAGNWPLLLDEAEGEFASRPLWLDLQRYVALALKGMGPAYAAAYHTVVAALATLCGRLPALLTISFKEGTPLADGATKAWLDSAGAELGLGGGGGGRGGPTADPLATAVEEARALLAEAKQAEAVARLARECERPAGRRDWFRAQLALASLCLDMNRLTLAASILEGLENEVGRYQLEEWEPGLAGQLWGRLCETYRRSKPKPTADEVRRINEVFARLGRLDPRAALALDQPASAGGAA